MADKIKDGYTERPFPKIRKATIDVLKASKRKNMIHSMIEADISNAREMIRSRKRETGQFISFTGYITYCVSKIVEKNKEMQAYRTWNNKLVIFDDVDVSTTVERKVDGRSEVVPMIIRSANAKSLNEISGKIRDAQEEDVESAEVFRFMNLYLTIPPFIRQLLFRIFDRFPHTMKKNVGTVMVTSVVMIGQGAGWGIPIASHTLNVTVGGIVKRPVEVRGEIESRDHVCLTISMDHDIIDGAPAARFIRQLKKMIESGKM